MSVNVKAKRPPRARKRMKAMTLMTRVMAATRMNMAMTVTRVSLRPARPPRPTWVTPDCEPLYGILIAVCRKLHYNYENVSVN
jgi:hypothetical protein